MRLTKFAGLAVVALGFVAMVGFAGCVKKDKEASPTSPTEPAGSVYQPHGAEERDLLAGYRPWKSGSIDIDPAWEADLEAWAKAGPAHVIVANMAYVPTHMVQSGFAARDTALYYALSRSYAGWAWQPHSGDSEAEMLKAREGEVATFWQNYISALSRVMEKTSMTAKLITHDGPDVLGMTLGKTSLNSFPDSVRSRVDLGDAVAECGEGTGIPCH